MVEVAEPFRKLCFSVSSLRISGKNEHFFRLTSYDVMMSPSRGDMMKWQLKWG